VELAKPIGRPFTLRCDAELGDSRCGYTLTADSGTVTSVTVAKRVFIDTAISKADGYYNGGKLTWTSGANISRTMDVKRYIAASDTVELYEPMPNDIVATDGYDIYQGCEKTITACKAFQGNSDNYRGCPYIPGISDLISGQTS
jgi:uncharacterized phage protein (TIGR02218 family)